MSTQNRNLIGTCVAGHRGTQSEDLGIAESVRQ